MPDQHLAPCVFCALIADGTTKFLRTWDDAVALVPLNPVTEGHVLIIPRRHVEDATERPMVTAQAMRRAAEWAEPPCNIITSAGREATQTVFHLHVHVVPRREGDGLSLPWTPQQGATPKPGPKPYPPVAKDTARGDSHDR